ncbi:MULTISPECIES: hypothetical protein [unclassified Corallococcus]|uniref:hypothetical protein n=1 Tax=unclassified Corallococcus TaxID=2685029 RepID=UPI001A8EC58A|nr:MULTISPECIES: hypothetical protein [unclassified Corallococcus]MBN9687529.1 hypothetical protein [Corallococcus sp. NCSPR001]WAS88650.1 hypothetical protein O0N60_17070 [Corallococcus sp. NCRR]
MASRTLLTMTSLLLMLSTPASAEDDTEARKKLVACINKDITAANSEWKLPAADLKKFTNIIDREIMKEPLAKKTQEAQMKIIADIKDGSRKELPNLADTTIDKMIETLKVKGQHCSTLVKH